MLSDLQGDVVLVGHFNVSTKERVTDFFHTSFNSWVTESHNHKDNFLHILLLESFTEEDLSLTFCNSEHESTQSVSLTL